MLASTMQISNNKPTKPDHPTQPGAASPKEAQKTPDSPDHPGTRTLGHPNTRAGLILQDPTVCHPPPARDHQVPHPPAPTNAGTAE